MKILPFEHFFHSLFPKQEVSEPLQSPHQSLALRRLRLLLLPSSSLSQFLPLPPRVPTSVQGKLGGPWKLCVGYVVAVEIAFVVANAVIVDDVEVMTVVAAGVPGVVAVSVKSAVVFGVVVTVAVAVSAVAVVFAVVAVILVVAVVVVVVVAAVAPCLSDPRFLPHTYRRASST